MNRNQLQNLKRRNNGKNLVDRLKRSGCLDCGIHNPTVLEFHHRDPGTKLFTIGLGKSRKTISQMLSEIEKCDLLCANCHLIREEDLRAR